MGLTVFQKTLQELGWRSGPVDVELKEKAVKLLESRTDIKKLMEESNRLETEIIKLEQTQSVKELHKKLAELEIKHRQADTVTSDKFSRALFDAIEEETNAINKSEDLVRLGELEAKHRRAIRKLADLRGEYGIR